MRGSVLRSLVQGVSITQTVPDAWGGTLLAVLGALMLITRAGTPTQTLKAGRLLVTTEPAPTTVPLPIRTPSRTRTPAPSHTSSSISIPSAHMGCS